MNVIHSVLESLLLAPAILASLASLAVAVTAIATAGLVVGTMPTARSCPLRRGLLVASLGVAVAAPAISFAARHAGLGWALERDARGSLAAAVSLASIDHGLDATSHEPMASHAPHVPPSLKPKRGMAGPALAPTAWWQIVGSCLCWTWLAGSVAGAARLACGLLQVVRLHRSTRPSRDDAARELLATSALAIGLRRSPRLVESDLLPVPAVVAAIHPMIVLPSSMASRLSRDRLAAVFLHESAHLLHGDLWVGLVQRLAAIAYWWCLPLHGVNRGLDELRERICDDHVVEVQGDGLRLAEVLVDAASRLHAAARRSRFGLGAVGMIDEHTGLEGRVRRLIAQEKGMATTCMNRPAVVATALFAVASMTVVVATTLRAADAAPKPADFVDDAKMVDAALEWIVRRQNPDGGWSFEAAKGNAIADRHAATAMALLPFLGRGHTHKDGPFKEPIAKGLDFLVDAVTKGEGRTGGTLYTQGLVTMALCRAYGTSKDAALAKPAQSAIDFIAAAQDPKGGGWRYQPKQPGDTSVLGWQFQALASGLASGLKLDPETVKKAVAFLDGVQGDDEGTTYGYTGPGKGPATTAIGLFVRSRSGWSPDDKRLMAGNKRLAAMPATTDLYFDYYVARSLDAAGDEASGKWRKQMFDLLAQTQVKEGDDKGSWLEGVDGGTGGKMAGRLYCTSMAVMILQVPAVTIADLGPLIDPSRLALLVARP